MDFYGYINCDIIYINILSRGKNKVAVMIYYLEDFFWCRCLCEERDNEEDGQKNKVKHIVMNDGCEF